MNKVSLFEALQKVLTNKSEIRFSKLTNKGGLPRHIKEELSNITCKEEYEVLLSHLILLALPTPSYQLH